MQHLTTGDIVIIECGGRIDQVSRLGRPKVGALISLDAIILETICRTVNVQEFTIRNDSNDMKTTRFPATWAARSEYVPTSLDAQ